MNYAWSFPQFIVSPDDGQLKNVVVGINWICVASDSSGGTATASGTVKLGKPNPAEFVPYSEITQDMAYQWVSGSISMSGVEAQLARQIAALSVPIIQPQNPPF